MEQTNYPFYQSILTSSWGRAEEITQMGPMLDELAWWLAFLFKPIQKHHLEEESLFNPQEGTFSKLLRSFSYAQAPRFFSILHVKNEQTLKAPAAGYQNRWGLSWTAGQSYVCLK